MKTKECIKRKNFIIEGVAGFTGLFIVTSLLLFFLINIYFFYGGLIGSTITFGYYAIKGVIGLKTLK